MGDIMLLGVLRIPFDTKGDLHLIQLQSSCLQAAYKIEADATRLKELEDEISEYQAEQCGCCDHLLGKNQHNRR